MSIRSRRPLAATLLILSFAIVFPALVLVACSDDDSPSSPSGGNNGGGSQELDSGTIGTGGHFSHTFATAGSYPYHCAFHPVMRAGVTVDASSSDMSESVSIVSSSSTGFQPSSVTIAPGGTVTWTNNDNVAHTVTSD